MKRKEFLQRGLLALVLAVLSPRLIQGLTESVTQNIPISEDASLLIPRLSREEFVRRYPLTPDETFPATYDDAIDVIERRATILKYRRKGGLLPQVSLM